MALVKMDLQSLRVFGVSRGIYLVVRLDVRVVHCCEEVDELARVSCRDVRTRRIDIPLRGQSKG